MARRFGEKKTANDGIPIRALGGAQRCAEETQVPTPRGTERANIGGNEDGNAAAKNSDQHQSWGTMRSNQNEKTHRCAVRATDYWQRD